MPVSRKPIMVPAPLFARAGVLKVERMPEASMLEVSRGVNRLGML